MSKSQSFLIVLFLILLIVLGIVVGRNVFRTTSANVPQVTNNVSAIERTTEILTQVANNPDVLTSDALRQFVTHGAVPVENNLGGLQSGRSNPFVPY